MKPTLALLLISSLTLAPLGAAAGETAACATSGTACCATSTAKASGSTCSEASGPSVTFKLKRAGRTRTVAALMSLDGVKAVETCRDTRFTTVSFDKAKVCSDTILAAVKTAGGSVQARRASFAVDDLSCGACVTQVTKALHQVKGVADAQVCAVSKVAMVDFNPGKTCSGTILAALDQAGFKATEVVQ